MGNSIACSQCTLISVCVTHDIHIDTDDIAQMKMMMMIKIAPDNQCGKIHRVEC